MDQFQSKHTGARITLLVFWIKKVKASPWNMHVWDEQACFKCLNCCSICPWISDYLMLIDTDRRNDKFWQIASSVDQHSLQFASDCANISIVFWHVTLLASSHFCGKNLWRSIVEQRVTSQNAMSVFELWSQLSRRISIPHSKISFDLCRAKWEDYSHSMRKFYRG